MSFLAEYHDPGLDVGKESTDKIEEQERERLARQLAIVTAAGEIPRRIGGDADAEELALDKRRAKRVAHVLRQSLAAWGATRKQQANLPEDEDVHKEAAQMDWAKWSQEHETWIGNRMRYIVTLCYKTNGDERWTKSATVRLRNESQWLRYALRD